MQTVFCCNFYFSFQPYFHLQFFIVDLFSLFFYFTILHWKIFHTCVHFICSITQIQYINCIFTYNIHFVKWTHKQIKPLNIVIVHSFSYWCIKNGTDTRHLCHVIKTIGVVIAFDAFNWLQVFFYSINWRKKVGNFKQKLIWLKENLLLLSNGFFIIENLCRFFFN